MRNLVSQGIKKSWTRSILFQDGLRMQGFEEQLLLFDVIRLNLRQKLTFGCFSKLDELVKMLISEVSVHTNKPPPLTLIADGGTFVGITCQVVGVIGVFDFKPVALLLDIREHSKSTGEDQSGEGTLICLTRYEFMNI